MLQVFTNLKLPNKGKQFWVRITHIRTPNEVVGYKSFKDACALQKCWGIRWLLWFLVLLQVFLSLVEPTVCEAEGLEEALREEIKNIDSLPLLTDFPIGLFLLVSVSEIFTLNRMIIANFCMSRRSMFG